MPRVDETNIPVNSYTRFENEDFETKTEVQAETESDVDNAHVHNIVVANGDAEKVNERTELVPAEDEDKKKSRSRRKLLVSCILFLACFGSGCGMSVPAPFYPREAASKNVSSTTTGMVFGCFQLVNFIFSPLFGQYITDLGPRRVCITGLMLAGSSSLCFGFLDKIQNRRLFEALSFIFRILEAIGTSGFTSACFTIISHECEDNIASAFMKSLISEMKVELITKAQTLFQHVGDLVLANRPLSWAVLETGVGIGLMIGPTIGGGLFQVGGFGLPFWVIGAMIVITGLLIIVFLPHVKEKGSGHSKGSILQPLRSPLVWVAMILLFVGATSMIFLDPTLSIHLMKFNLTPFEISLFFVICPMLHAILAPFYGYLSDKKDIIAPLMLTACITCPIGLCMIGPTPLFPFLPNTIWFKVLGMFVMGSFFSATLIQTMKCLLMGAMELGLPGNMNTYGLVAGLFNSVFFFGSFVGPTIGGVMMDTVGFETGTTYIAGMYLVTFLVLALFFGYRRAKRIKNDALLKNQHYDDIHPQENTF